MNCGTCRWFVPASREDLECDDVDGVCVRYPPTCGFDSAGCFWQVAPEVCSSGGGCGEYVFTSQVKRLADVPRPALYVVRSTKED